MLKKWSALVILILLIQFNQIVAQGGFQSPYNPLYWKNRPPKPGYWQQDVHYTINATLNDGDQIIDAFETLIYYNNSPDTLKRIYFHLYQNAFQPESYLHQLEEANGVKSKFGKWEKQKLGCEIQSVSINRKNVGFVIDNTIMMIELDDYILPGRSAEINIKFKTYFDSGSMRRRMKVFSTYGFKHFDGVHWYPRICVYDAKFGWETDQHLGKEFYGDYGWYDVELTLPSHYVLEATGLLINRDEVLPEEYRERIDIKNFKTLPNPYVPNACNMPDGKTKTWKFHAENVHDFAWTADPLYRMSEVDWNGIRCVAIAQEHNAWGWQDAAQFVASVIATYSRDFGMYAYPKMVAADARDGMEYPMLTLDGGVSPGYHGVIAHEIGHNWFFGMVGNNETYRAALDEGFTQFLTGWSLTKLDGKYPIRYKTKSKYYNFFREFNSTVVSNIYLGYLTDAMTDNDEPLNTHSDHFNGALGHGGGYRHVYYKTATMLMNLQYVLGDDLFLEAMKNYVNQWKICHPYFEDFRSSIIQFTKVDLNWFFDQWLETTHKNDYGIKMIKKIKDPARPEGFNYSYSVTLKRYQRMQMPLDLTVIDENRDTGFIYISNSWFFKKNSDGSRKIKWTGWDNLNDKLTFNVYTKAPLHNVIIDPSHRMSDIDYLDNSWNIPVRWRFDAQIKHPPDLYNYRNYWRPVVWYNQIDGIKAGLNLRGHYMNLKHKYEAQILFNTRLGYNKDYEILSWPIPWVNYSVLYKTRIAGNSDITFSSRLMDGLFMNEAGIEKTNQKGTTWYWKIKSMYRQTPVDLLYSIDQGLKNGKWNNFSDLGFTKTMTYQNHKSSLNITMNLRTPALFSDYMYSQARFTAVNHLKNGKVSFKTRLIAQTGTGNVAPESRLNLAGANAEELVSNKYTRSLAFIPKNYVGYGNDINHFQQSGGLNLRGYAGYLAPELNNGIIYTTFQGNSGAALNVELDADAWFYSKLKKYKGRFRITPYLFADAGFIYYSTVNSKQLPGTLRADAGLGTVLTFNKIWRWDDIRPLTLRIDFPVYLSNAPFGAENLSFRWVVGINRLF